MITDLLWLLKVLARTAFRIVFDKRVPAALAPPKNILLIRWDGKLGDAIVSSFFCREVKKLSGVTVSVVTTVDLKEFYRDHFGAQRIYVLPVNPGLLSLLRLLGRLRDVDTVVHLVGRIRARELLFLYLLRPRNIFSLDDDIGWVNGKMREATRSLLFNEKYAYVLHQLGIRDIDTRYQVPVPISDPCSRRGRQLAVFNPFASRPDKSISREKASYLLRLLANRMPDWDVSILYRPETFAEATEMRKAANCPNVRIIDGILTFKDAISVINEADLIVSVDTGFVHVADGLGKMLIAICPRFDGEFNAWLPRPSRSTQIVWCQQDGVSYRRTAKKDMDNFCDDDIHDALEGLIDSTLEARAALHPNSPDVSPQGVLRADR